LHYAPEHFLDKNADTGRLMAHARLLLKLSRRFETIAPAPLRNAARIANYKSGKVVIHADNGAVAAKIRQMSRRLCDELSTGATQCSDIEVKVQPRQNLYQSMGSTQKPISSTSAKILRSTGENLPKGPLREALETLLRRSLIKE
jgi:hypothetical protein